MWPKWWSSCLAVRGEAERIGMPLVTGLSRGVVRHVVHVHRAHRLHHGCFHCDFVVGCGRCGNGIGTPVCGIGMVVVVYFYIGATQLHSEFLLFLSGLDFFFVVKEAEAGFVVERAIVFVWLSH